MDGSKTEGVFEKQWKVTMDGTGKEGSEICVEAVLDL